jgi:DNA-directed RNA polymerase alpha subunit
MFYASLKMQMVNERYSSMTIDAELAAADERIEAARHELKAALTARQLVLDKRKTPAYCAVTMQQKYLPMFPLDWLNISMRARNTLKDVNCRTLGDAVAKSRRNLLDTNCCGEGTVAEIQAMLVSYGLSLKREE